MAAKSVGSKTRPVTGRGNEPVAARLQSAARAAARDVKQAEAILVGILNDEPANSDALRLYGGILRKTGRLAEARALLQAAATGNPNSSDIRVGLGLVYRDLGDAPEAIRSFESALEVDPDSWYALCNLGTVLRETGQFDDACERFVAALRINPSLPEAWNGLARSARYDEAPPYLDDIKAVAENAHPMEHRVQALYALAKILDDIGDYGEAFEYAERANSISRKPAAIDLGPAFLQRVDSYFTDARLQSLPRLTVNDIEPGPTPVFVLGMPRSGTTLMEQFFAAHPHTSCAGETNFFGDWGHTTENRLPRPDQYPEATDSLTAPILKDMRKRFFRCFDMSDGPLVLVDRTPFNYAYLPVISAVLPDARIIHLMRDDYDRGISIFLNEFAPVYPFTRSLQGIGEYSVAYRRLMTRWHETAVLPILDIQYEDFVSDPEGHGRRILEFCGLDWDEACLQFYRSNRLVSTPSDWQVRQPMYTSSIGRGGYYKDFLGPLRDALGE
ncbi:MAG: sulfotransferase [Rhodospirillales bacterium]